eukprot:1152628-Pelagomonas_calceolata.AAC.4
MAEGCNPTKSSCDVQQNPEQDVGLGRLRQDLAEFARERDWEQMHSSIPYIAWKQKFLETATSVVSLAPQPFAGPHGRDGGIKRAVYVEGRASATGACFVSVGDGCCSLQLATLQTLEVALLYSPVKRISIVQRGLPTFTPAEKEHCAEELSDVLLYLCRGTLCRAHKLQLRCTSAILYYIEALYPRGSNPFAQICEASCVKATCTSPHAASGECI